MGSSIQITALPIQGVGVESAFPMIRSVGSTWRSLFWKGWVALNTKPLRIMAPLSADFVRVPFPRRFGE